MQIAKPLHADVNLSVCTEISSSINGSCCTEEIENVMLNRMKQELATIYQYRIITLKQSLNYHYELFDSRLFNSFSTVIFLTWTTWIILVLIITSYPPLWPDESVSKIEAKTFKNSSKINVNILRYLQGYIMLKIGITEQNCFKYSLLQLYRIFSNNFYAYWICSKKCMKKKDYA